MELYKISYILYQMSYSGYKISYIGCKRSYILLSWVNVMSFVSDVTMMSFTCIRYNILHAELKLTYLISHRYMISAIGTFY